MSTESRQDLLVKVDPDRREFLRKIAIAAAFAAPTVATFSLDGVRKKALAQGAYDQPYVVGLTQPDRYRAVVEFSHAMDTGAGGDSARIAAPSCRQVWFSGEGAPATPSVTWSGNKYQVIQLPECAYNHLHITYNQPSCGAAKFRGANGVELLPYSGSILIDNRC